METGSAAPRDGQGPLAQYVLSDAESRRIFEEEIVPAELGHLADHTDADADADAEPPAGDGQDGGGGGGGGPVAVLLVGQTGAGKTRTAPLLAAAMSGSSSGTRRPRVAHLIADTYKTYHPAYASLAAQKPTLASPATGPDARRWLAMACGLAAARGADCVVESACRHPADFEDLVRLFASSSSSSQNKRYAVRVVVLAVPEALSRLGILVRFHHALPEARSGRLPLRLTPVPVHDATFAGLLDAAAWLDGGGDDGVPADDVVVLRRGNRVAYSYSRRPCLSSSSSSSPAAAAAVGESSAVGPALLRERRRPLTPEELRVAGAELDALRSLAGADRPQLGAQVAEVEELLRGLESPPPPPATCGDGAGDYDGPFPDLQPFNPEAFVKHGRSV
ncbi:hypothetical protein RB597_002377 [Gaeumannomyces tritici]